MSIETSEVAELLDSIAQKYPPSRIATAQAKYKNLWDFSTPFTAPPIAIHRGVIMDGKSHPAHHTQEERQATLTEKLRHIAALADIQDDYTPVLTLDVGAYIIGNAFGAKPAYRSKLYLTKPLIFSSADAANLPDFSPQGENFLMRKVFTMLQFMKEQTAGRIPINIHTPQGPLETLSVMWESTDFMISLLTEPEIVDTAMAKVFAAYRYYLRAQMKIIGSELLRSNFAMSYTSRPANTGIGVGEDLLALISSEVFARFSPIYKTIADDFGSLLIHSCGDPSHQLENLLAMPEVKGFHFSQVPPEKYVARLTRPLVIHSPNDWRDLAALENFVRLAKEYDLRFCLQIQSLDDAMQVGKDTTKYELAKVAEMYSAVRAVVNRYYG